MNAVVLAPPLHFQTFADVQEYLAEQTGRQPFDFPRDAPGTLKAADELGVGPQVAEAIELSRVLDPVIDASVERDKRTHKRRESCAVLHVPTSQPIDWRALADKEPPPRQWAITGWLGFGHVTLLVGAGGIGKTLLAQQVSSCLALAKNFIDEIREPRRVLMWCCEDDHDELWRRQQAIAAWMGVGLDAFAENLHIVARHGLDNAVATTEFGRLMLTPLLRELHQQAEDLSADVVILDNAAQIFGGSENDRHQVTAFVNALHGALPGCAILLLAHPARSAGSEFSGSSAWENTARTRLYLGDRLPDEKADPDAPSAEDVRFLARRKANYSVKDYRRFTFRDHVLVPEAIEAAGGMVGALRDQAADRIVLEGLTKLRARGIRATEGQRSPDFLPALLIAYKFAEGRTRSELAAAMRRLVIDGSIEKAVVGRYEGNRSQKLGLQVVHK
jgi:hypothetical protein